ncbi:MAG: DUF1801 domain-containing protein [Euryarchaeota archaeon]|nr:DUF1801 domain-containing protein [Euryarchaeota archaeon]
MKKATKTVPAKDVDKYLASVPKEARNVLEKLRKIIKASAPNAVEKISYRMPTFNYHGPLVGFAAFKNHCGFYIMSYKVMDMFKEELRPYDTATATIRFTTDKPLPVSLVKKLVKARIKENEVKSKKVK